MPYVKQITIRATLNRSLKYIVNESKTDFGCLVTGVNCATNDKLAYKQMLANKKKHDKEKGTLGFHFIQSFKEHEISDPYKAHEIGLKWAEKMFGDKYQFIISTHMDKGHIHNHLIINSVSLDGNKFNSCKKSLKDARDFSDEVAKEYGLGTIQKNKGTVSKSYKEWKEDKRGNSWKSKIKQDIDTVIQSSNSFEEFMDRMSQLGYTMKQGHVKYMTFKAPGMERSVRGKTLGEDYTEDRIKERIRFKEFNFDQAKRASQNRFNRTFIRRRQSDPLWKYQFRRGTLATNFMLTISLIRTLMERNADDGKRKNVKRNFRGDIEISKLSNKLKFITEHNLKSRSDLKQAIEKVENQIKQMSSVLHDANEMNLNMKLVVQAIDAYNKHKPIYDEYQTSTIKKLFMKKKYNVELETFEKAAKQLEKMGVNQEELSAYLEKQKSYEAKMEQLQEKLDSSKDVLEKLRDIEVALTRSNSLIESLKSRNEKQKLQKDER